MKRALIVLTGTTVSVVAALNYTPHQILAPINDQTAIGTDGFSFADPSPVPTSSANSSASPSPSITITKPKTTDTKKPAVVSPKNSSAPTQKKAPKVIPVVPKQNPPDDVVINQDVWLAILGRECTDYEYDMTIIALATHGSRRVIQQTCEAKERNLINDRQERLF